MTVIRAFTGIRPRADRVGQVASPPYDVMNAAEAKQMAGNNDASFLHVVKAEIDFPDGTDPHSDVVYQKGAENLQKLLARGILQRDVQPSLYLYEQTMGEHRQRGIIAAVSVAEYEQGIIKKHELTRPDKEDDRTRHIDILNAHTGPVMLTYRAKPKIDRLSDEICDTTVPVYDFVARDNVRHRFWVVSDPAPIAALQACFQEVAALYIADGHHRSAAAARVAALRRAHNPHHTGQEPYNYFLGVLFPHDQLQILGYYRAIKDLNGLDPDTFLSKIATLFDVTTTDTPIPSEKHQFGMYLDGQWYRLVAKADTFTPNDPVQSLDVSILQENLICPILDIQSPRTDQRIAFIGGIRGSKALEQRCHEDMRVAFTLYPTSVEQLMDIADSGAIMPPKSTWFEPKLYSGVVVHSLSEA